MKSRRNVVVPTEFGMMMVNRFDYNAKENFPGVGHHILNHGVDNMESVLMFSKYLEHARFPVVVDVGANIGVFTVQVAKNIQDNKGTVYAFEPQRQIFQMLNGNLALNSIDNAYTYLQAVGATETNVVIPKLDYYSPGSFGSVGLTGELDDVGQDLDFGNGEKVQQVTIDSFFKSFDNVDAIKIDVEGMEHEVINGAINTINKHRPLLYIEYIKLPNNGAMLGEFLTSLGYKILVSHINFLCIPEEKMYNKEYSFIQGMINDGP